MEVLENGTIDETLEKFAEAWNSHNAKAFAELFAADADFTNVFGQKAKGREAIELFHAPMFSGMFKESRLNIKDVGKRMVRPDVAAIDALWTMVGAMDPNGNPWPDREGLMNLIMTGENGTWLITVMHNMDLPLVPGQ